MKKSMPKAILFDLDGTLLPMDQDAFLADYFARLTQYMAAFGYDPRILGKSVWAATGAMLANDGSATNETRFWEAFSAIYSGAQGAFHDVQADMPYFEDFYRTEFDKIGAVCGRNAQAISLICDLKQAGIPIVLATNPVFPAVATRKRIAWAGLSPDDFALVTTYENSHYAKPTLGYYREIAAHLGIAPEDCLMVGNDVDDDLVASGCGMEVFLLTDCLINKQEKDLTPYARGGFDALRAYIFGQNEPINTEL